LEFRAAGVKLSIPFKTITRVAARGGTLTVDSKAGGLSLTLGDAAERWAIKIQHPPSRLDKLGVKPGSRVSALGVDDTKFLDELEDVAGRVSIGRAAEASDIIFYSAETETALNRLAALKRALKPAGALWVIRPKASALPPARRGSPPITEAAVM